MFHVKVKNISFDYGGMCVRDGTVYGYMKLDYEEIRHSFEDEIPEIGIEGEEKEDENESEGGSKSEDNSDEDEDEGAIVSGTIWFGNIASIYNLPTNGWKYENKAMLIKPCGKRGVYGPNDLFVRIKEGDRQEFKTRVLRCRILPEDRHLPDHSTVATINGNTKFLIKDGLVHLKNFCREKLHKDIDLSDSRKYGEKLKRVISELRDAGAEIYIDEKMIVVSDKRDYCKYAHRYLTPLGIDDAIKFEEYFGKLSEKMEFYFKKMKELEPIQERTDNRRRDADKQCKI